MVEREWWQFAGLSLPPALAPERDDDAVALLNSYYAPMDGAAGFTGGAWDSFDPSGTRATSTNTFTSDDIVSVGLLSVDIPARAALAVLGELRPRLETLLQALGSDRDLAGQESVDRDGFAAAWDLWKEIDELPGMGTTKTSKLLARKRPRLLPIIDAVVHDGVFGQKPVWISLHQALRENLSDRTLHEHLVHLREAAGLGAEVSALRVFDVVCWLEGTASP